jgi:hypothetical protein
VSAPEDEDRERFQLSAAQVAASSLAAMSSAVICSFFGVAGTVIGTAVASLVATIGGALYSYSLRRTKARLRRLHLAGANSPPFREVVKTARQQSGRIIREIPWRAMALGAGCVFVFSLGVITAIEEAQGETLSAIFGVSHGSSRDNSLGGVFGVGHHKSGHKPKSKKTPSHSPTPTTSASTSPSPPASTTPSPTATATPSTTPTTPGNVISSILHPSSSPS